MVLSYTELMLYLAIGTLLAPFAAWAMCSLVAWPIRRRIKAMKNGPLKRILLMRIGDPSPMDPDRDEMLKKPYFRP